MPLVVVACGTIALLRAKQDARQTDACGTATAAPLTPFIRRIKDVFLMLDVVSRLLGRVSRSG